MEIILLKDIDTLGERHEIVNVKPGFARNYLIPTKMALAANSTNKAKLEKLRSEEAAHETDRINDFKTVAARLEGQSLRIGAKAGTTGKIFGSVTSVQIMQALKDQMGIDVIRKKIELPEEVKVLGTYTANINFHPEVHATIKFEVVEE
ncbi:MAG TPA: 50S ribosomal protein L9 [Saprospiraceae bacterium]|nr:50S ribosomal protein L9 [Saprospiraceae bacterium]